MIENIEHDDNRSAENEISSAWTGLRQTAAVFLIFCGAFAIFILIRDQFVESHRPARPLVALTLGAVLLAAGYSASRRPKPPVPSAERRAISQPGAVLGQPTASALWVLFLAPAALGGLALYGPLWGDLWLTLGGSAFLGIWATALGVPFLRELVRWAEWVPPGSVRHPVLVAIALTAILATAVVAVLLTLTWLERRAGLGS